MLNRMILFLVLGWTSWAQATVIVTTRSDWFHSGGYFHQVQGGGGAWAETINAVESFYFAETARNNAYVELFDRTRNLYVRLYSNAMYLKGPADAQFRHFYNGNWDDRRLYNYRVNEGPAYFNLYTAEIWRWARPGHPIVYLRETLRNEAQIQLYNAREGYTISLLDNEIWMKVDGNSWFRYAAGRW